MGRRPGSKNRSKTNGEETAGPGPGHNHELTDDERRALALHHKRAWMEADELVEAAKADLGKGALADIRDLILFDDDVKAKATIERHMRLARWAGVPIGFQVDMFGDRQPDDVRHEAAGKTAGMAGETCAPPAHLGPADAQLWIRGWHSGQAVLASALGKRRDDAPGHVLAADTSQQAFA